MTAIEKLLTIMKVCKGKRIVTASTEGSIRGISPTKIIFDEVRE